MLIMKQRPAIRQMHQLPPPPSACHTSPAGSLSLSSCLILTNVRLSLRGPSTIGTRPTVVASRRCNVRSLAPSRRRLPTGYSPAALEQVSNVLLIYLQSHCRPRQEFHTVLRMVACDWVAWRRNVPAITQGGDEAKLNAAHASVGPL